MIHKFNLYRAKSSRLCKERYSNHNKQNSKPAHRRNRLVKNKNSSQCTKNVTNAYQRINKR
jgi:hypothetical protein